MRTLAILLTLTAVSAWAGEWSEPVEVRQEVELCLTYRAMLAGDYLVVEASPQPGWHTFVMDNKQRAAEKLAGKRSLGIDAPTEITLSGGLEPAGDWYQTPPKEFSKPELRWFSWGYESPARFVTKVSKTAAGPARIAIKAQACTETTCKNIDVALSLPLEKSTSAAIDLKSLLKVRQE